MVEVELTKTSDAHFGGLFLDPSGKHVLANLQILGVPEVHYLHANWKKPRLLNKLKGTNVTALAWHPSDVSDSSTG